MDISYNELKNKEIVNLCNGTKMGHIVDVVFDSDSGKVSGLVAPGEKRVFKKTDDIFIPLEKVRRIGDDVILVRFEVSDSFYGKYNKKSEKTKTQTRIYSSSNAGENSSYIRFRKLDNKKYK